MTRWLMVGVFRHNGMVQLDYTDDRQDIRVTYNAFLNACDCLHYGYGKTYWSDCGIDEQYRDLVWKQARYFVAEEED